jgi:hypothetical protein
MNPVSTSNRVGASVKSKQFKLYDMCYDYLIDNFHKFTPANKLKVSLALAVKMAPNSFQEDNEVLINQELTFDDIPSNGDGLTRFQEFLHK